MNLKSIFYITAAFIISSCSAEKHSNSVSPSGPNSSSNEQVENNSPMQQNTSDFKATGNEPFWSLEIDFDQKMHFKSLNYPEEMITPVPKPEKAQDHPVTRYRAVTEKGELMVQISPDPCADTMSDQKFPFSVKVSVKASSASDYTEFEGCGRFLLDSRLHNIWALQEMDGEPISAEGFNQGLPTLEIYAAEGRVAGHDGCNRLFGKLIGNEKRLTFGALGSTMMACPNMERGTRFVKLISDQSFEYEFQPRQLVFKQNNEVVLRFKNVD